MYYINAYIHWPQNGVGTRITEFRLNGTTYVNGASDSANFTVNDCRHSISALLYLNAEEYIELTGYQTSGNNLTPTTQTFSIVKLI